MAQHAVRRARQSIINLMEQTIMRRCLLDNGVLYLPCQGRAFTLQELRAEWRQGRYIWGPQWWQVRPYAPR